ncbi:unnamed protein product [Rotaria sp. Silwood1]|nr:unnamed protein product [Rotaria sp. Silwood1]CAF0853664.1 unnamed protein product [Rotaria sp. Silwood1]CAF0869245.1 unnamed protein product [Rotaria sp. Silwood1]CAF3362879.1 unnamed protein product [Rotaria sp. Silwood1]CAF3376973.1 unnamed protein product [Rotaria sp. Silwood1]
MTDFAKVFNIYSTESNQDQQEENQTFGEVKRANASINQDFSKNFVRVTIKIPKMKTGMNWRKLIRQPNNGIITEATYHGNRLNFEFILNRGKSNETKYEFSTREPLHGPIEYHKSFLKYKDEYVLWFVHKSQPW